jgi:uncharacterized protein YjdB
VTNSTTLTVAPATLVSIAVTPANPSATAGAALQFTATGTYTDSSTKNITAAVVWASSNSATATISNTGLAAGLAPGSSSISATLGSVTNSTTLTVAPATLVSIAVTPANPSATAGAALQFTATGTYTDNTTRDLTTQVVWASSNSSVASVSSTGAVTGVAAGTATVSASLNGVRGSTTVTVTVAAPPPPSGGGYTLFSASAAPTGNAQIFQPLEVGMRFSSERDGFISAIRFYKGANNTGTHVGELWTNLGQLLATVTFTNETASGWQQATLTPPMAITANTLYLVSYHSEGGFSVDEGYFASPVDNPPLHAPANTVFGNGLMGFGPVGTFPQMMTGTGRNYWVDVLFTSDTTPPPSVTLNSIQVTPANPSIGVGSTQQFKATGTYSDNSTNDLTNQVNWSSSNTSVGTIGSTGLASGIAAGTSTISATLSGISGSTLLTVTAAPPPPSGGGYTLFSASAAPTGNAQIFQPLEVGMRFSSERDGFISAIRFYKGANNTGTHVGELWTNLGQLLATVTFTNETASGWQQATLTPPMAITANTLYLVSYHSEGGFSVDEGYFASPVDNPPLHAPANTVFGNGLMGFGPVGTFPQMMTSTGRNYWVDVLFTPK